MPSPTTSRKPRLKRLRWCIVWVAFGTLRALVALPLRWQLSLGRIAGRLCHRLIRGRRHVVDRNLAACFAQMPADERARLCLAHFEALGMSVVEMAMGWYADVARIESCVTIEGLEHLRAALRGGNGVILFSAHLTSFEIFFPVLRQHCPRLAGMYKVQRNALMNEIMNAGRGRNIDFLFPKDSVRDMLRELGANSVIWYASDQKYTGSNSALIPFFAVPAMTNTAISRIAGKTKAVVLPYFCRRLPGSEPRYVANIFPALEGFPSADARADVGRFVALLEDYIRQCPEQYWWIHQRFKDRPDELPDIYSRERSSS